MLDPAIGDFSEDNDVAFENPLYGESNAWLTQSKIYTINYSYGKKNASDELYVSRQWI